jgi:hypothetical protein
MVFLKLSWNQTQNTSVLFGLKVLFGAIGEINPVSRAISQKWQSDCSDSKELWKI